MKKHDCVRARKVIGKYQCDLSRFGGEPQLYNVQFRAAICAKCGRTELFCDSHQAACEWLGKVAHGSNQPIDRR
jgi:hypothetical protein